MELNLHSKAREETFVATRYYNTRIPGLGGRFIEELDACLQEIAQFPNLGVYVGSACRRRVLHGFPYSLIYQVHDNGIYIIAVMHQSRKPGYWKKRL